MRDFLESDAPPRDARESLADLISLVWRHGRKQAGRRVLTPDSAGWSSTVAQPPQQTGERPGRGAPEGGPSGL